VTGQPEAITRDELRASIDRLGWYMQTEAGGQGVTYPADRIIQDVEHHREPGSLSVPVDEYPAFRAPEPLVMPQDELAAVRQLAAAARAADAAYKVAAVRVVLYEFLHQYGRSVLPAFKVALDLASSLRNIIDDLAENDAAGPAPDDTGQDLPAAPEQARERAGADVRESLGRLVHQAEIAWAKEQPHPWPIDRGESWEEIHPAQRELFMRIGEAVSDEIAGEIAVRLEHAEAALAGDNEGIRLWMLDCASLVQKHREHAVEASARLGEQHARAEMAEERLAEIATLCRNPAAFVGQTMGAGRVVPGDRMAARILSIIGGEEPGRG
jgi:hypothetical protein